MNVVFPIMQRKYRIIIFGSKLPLVKIVPVDRPVSQEIFGRAILPARQYFLGNFALGTTAAMGTKLHSYK